MRKSLLSVIMLVVLVVSTGCGKEKRVILPPVEKVVYDLASYIFPDKNQTNNYMDNVVIDHSGKGVYAGEGNTTYYPMKFVADETNIKSFNNKNDIVSEYNIKDTFITQVSVDINYTIIREVTTGKRIIAATENTGEEGDAIYTEKTISCILDSHISSKEVLSKTYDDILVVVCDNPEKKVLTDEDVKLSTIISNKITIYYAKSIGAIYSKKEKCKESIIGNDSPYKKECERTVTELMYSS